MAQALTQDQIDSVLNLLASFDVDEETMVNVERALIGETTPSIPAESFERDLGVGSTGLDVKRLQKWLNQNGYTVATTGPGSLGNESEYYGELTRQAVARYQSAKDISPAVGYFGPKTRGVLNAEQKTDKVYQPSPVSPVEEEDEEEVETVRPDEPEKENGYIDCGKTTFKFEELFLSWTQDESQKEKRFAELGKEPLKCFGKELRDHCEEAKVILDTDGYGVIEMYTMGKDVYDIEGEEKELCVIKIVFGDEDKIVDEDRKAFADTYLKCPFLVETDEEFYIDVVEYPAYMVPEALGRTLMYIGFYELSLQDDDREEIPLYCSGSFMDAVIE